MANLKTADWVQNGRWDAWKVYSGTTQAYPVGSPFVTYANSIGTNLQVLHMYDETSGTTTVDRRDGQSARTGTYNGTVTRSFDGGVDRGANVAQRIFGTGGFVLVNSFTGDAAGTFTFAFVFKTPRFVGAHALNAGAGTGYNVSLVDNGENYTVRLTRAGEGTVCDSTVTISDTWKWHTLIVSMGGTTASARIILDGVNVTGSITARTNGTAANRWCYQPLTANEQLFVGGYAEWSRQLTPTEETNLHNAMKVGYRTRPVLHGIHAGTQFFDVGYHQQIVDACAANLNPQIVRLDLRWHYIEASDGAPYDWSKLDSAIDKYTAIGAEILVTIAGSPTWLTGGASEFSIPAPAGYAAWLAAYQEFVQVAVARYKDRVHYWELGNEQNYGAPDEGFWRSLRPWSTSTTSFTAGTTTTITLNNAGSFAASGSGTIQAVGQVRTGIAWTGKSGNQLTGVTASGGSIHGIGAQVQEYTDAQWGKDYVDWANALRTTIVAEDPTAEVSTGGILGWGGIGRGIIGGTFAFWMWNQGISTNFTHFAMHPYCGTNGPRNVISQFDNNFHDVQRYRETLIAQGKGAATIWVTEYGWYSSSDVNANLATTTTRLNDSFNDIRDYHSKYVDMCIYFCDFDRPDSGFYGVQTGINGLHGYSGTSLVPRTTATAFKALSESA